jgi:hypothetical protein
MDIKEALMMEIEELTNAVPKLKAINLLLMIMTLNLKHVLIQSTT